MALTFTTTANVNFGSGASLALSGAAQTWSWCGWIYPTTDTAGRPFSIGAGGTDHKRLIVRPTFSLRMATLRAGGTTNDQYDSAAMALTPRTWQFVAIVYDSSAGAGLRFLAYRGSFTSVPVLLVMTATDGAGNCDDDSADNYFAGNSSALTDPFNGILANFAYFPGVVLSAGQVAQLWQSLRAAILMGAHLYSELGYTALGTQPDLTGNANHGTITGAKLAAGPVFYPPRDFLFNRLNIPAFDTTILPGIFNEMYQGGMVGRIYV